ncbi:hypothetical protein DJ031_04695 [bacterium endosymbiont of Escarpia laminata]|nr:MAG: hypothetical protein DJ031_04695 [bacterium endosymbiont of Escarpia laminata]
MNKRRCFLLHGYNVDNGGAETVEKLVPYIAAAGFDPVCIDYGHFNLIDVRVNNDDVGSRLVQMIRPGDVFIGHSNGCAIAAMAIEAGAPFARGVMIHPALQSFWSPPLDHPIEQVAVFSRWSDYATWSAFLLRVFSPGRLVWGRHIWGAMGATGPLSKDPRIVNKEGAHFHSNGFKDPEKWCPVWVDTLTESCEKSSEIGL